MTTSGRSENVGVLLGKGDGTFEAPVTYVGALYFGMYATFCAAGDVNADGKLDLVVYADYGIGLSHPVMNRWHCSITARSRWSTTKSSA